MAKKIIERNTFGVDEKLEQEFNYSHLKRSLKYVKKYAEKIKKERKTLAKKNSI